MRSAETDKQNVCIQKHTKLVAKYSVLVSSFCAIMSDSCSISTPSIGSSKKTNKETARIVIIGAGSSGIAAATRLLEQGFKHVQLLEAEDRIGGRIHTIPFADNVIDLGAQWCHGETGNVVYEMVKDLNLVERTGDDRNGLRGRFIRSNRQILPQETANILLDIMENITINEHDNYEGSHGDYVTQIYWKEVAKKLPSLDPELSKEALKVIKLLLCGWEGCDHLFEVSSTDYFVDCEGDNLVNWRDKGFKSILRVLMKSQEDQPDDLGVLTGRVLLNRRISQINWGNDDKLTLRLWNGEILQPDHVICTVSLGVLKEQHAELFVPRLPEAKVRAIKGLNLGTVDKFLLEFTSPPMPEDIEGFQCLWLEKDLAELRGTEMFWLESVSGFDCVSHQPRLLEGWIIGAHARHMETLTEAKVLEGIQWLFGKFLNFEIPQPKRFVRTQWHSNPNFRGSYSYRTTYADELDVGPWDLATPILDINGRPKLQFAGEASSKTHSSTVHGAIETGWREADRLNNYYTERGAN